MKPEYLSALLQNGESETVEFKTNFNVSAFKEAGLIERYGSGIGRIRKICSEFGIPEPEYQQMGIGFMVTLKKNNFSKEQYISENHTENNTEEPRITKKKQRILEYLPKNPTATRKDLVNHLEGDSLGGIIYNLQVLRKKGLITRIGSDRDGYWKVNIL